MRHNIYVEIAAGVAVVGVGIFVAQVAFGWLMGWLAIKAAPREPMFICVKHGPIRRQNLIQFSDYEGMYTDIDGKVKAEKGDWDYCTLCYNERQTAAERTQ